MELRQVLVVLRRRWWLVVGLPLVVFAGTLVQSANQPYTATVQAVVLIPGDTETTGNAERPELMVLDDGPTLVTSPAFAGLVKERLGSGSIAQRLDADDVQGALSAERYSRTLTIQATRADPDEALAIGRAVANVLPDAVNRYLVAAGAQPATVEILRRPTEAVRDLTSRGLILIVQTLVALVAGAGLAALAASLDDRLYADTDVVERVGLPVIGDVRMPRRSLPEPPWLRGERA